MNNIEVNNPGVSPDSICASEIRLYRNGTDPTSADPGMNGADLSQGFTLGGTNEVYDTNSVNQGYLAQMYGDTLVCRGDSITLYTDSIQNAIYSWNSMNNIIYPSEPQITVSSELFNGIDTVFFTLAVTKDSMCSTPTNTQYVVIHDLPNVSIDGPDNICIGSTTNLLPGTGGTWVSSDNAIAIINNDGIVTAVSAGMVFFTFTETATGCSSIASAVVTVHVSPTVSVDGPDEICAGSTTQVYPNAGGTWASSDTSIATVTNSGLVWGKSSGIVDLTYEDTTTNCVSIDIMVTVYSMPIVSITGDDRLCVGETSTLLPNAEGSWASSDNLIATVTADGTVTAIGAGVAFFTFTNTDGCESLPTNGITVDPTPIVNIDGSDEICIGGTTYLSPVVGGFWTSSDGNIATVSAAGIVTGGTEGCVSFIFQDATTGCKSDPTDTICVIARPIIVITGPDELCIGETSTITPATGGTWVSNNAAIATIDNAGIVTAVSAGSTFFTFTDATTGCVSQQSEIIIVNGITEIGISGPSEFCVGFTTQIYPISGGTWVFSDTSIVEITNAGLVTGISAGSVDINRTDITTTCESNSITITILARTDVSITGDDRLCVGETSTLSPTVGGSWASSDNGIATVAADGTVTAIAEGVAFFTFTDATTGCESLPTDGITVDSTPLVNIDGSDEICIGSTTALSPATGGTWVSGDVSIALVDVNTGVVTAVAEGTVKFIFTDTASGCVSDSTADVTILPVPETVLADANICVGQTTSITPSVGGSWISTNPAVALITSSGIIATFTSGQTGFIFTDTSTGCSSAVSDSLTVEPGPTIVITGADELCIGETTTLTPTTGGTWTSSDDNIATITNAGLVTGITIGMAYFRFTETASGCSSVQSDAVTVHPTPTVSVDGDTTICVEKTTNLLPNSGGTWVSSNPSIATVDNSGLVTGVAVGSVSFTFTDSTTGCETIATLNIEVLDASDPLCISANNDIEKELINIYPNPTIDILHISGISKYDQVWITSITGKKIDVKVQYKNNRVIINTSEIVPGVYFICIHSSENLVAKKMIKM